MSRNPDRCPTHPGELLREDVIPRPTSPKQRSHACLAFRASIFMTSVSGVCAPLISGLHKGAHGPRV